MAGADDEMPNTLATGDLFLYHKYGLAAFEIGGRGCGERAVVCIPGLTDGLLSLRYMPDLAKAVQHQGWRVVQPVLSSSYRGWGTGSLDEDADEIDTLLAFLNKRRGVKNVVLLGHSTGCQDVIRYLKVGRLKSMVSAAVLQAPVSDREAASLNTEETVAIKLQNFKDMAADMILTGRGDEVMPREASSILGPPHAVTAFRFDSLTGRMTQDDMFSSDLSDSELRDCLGHVAVPTLLALSGADEYVPNFVDAGALGERMKGAMAATALKLVEHVIIDGGDHGLLKNDSASLFIETVTKFLTQIEGCPRLSWEAEAAEQIRKLAAEKSPGQPLLVAVAGMPGAGKSTSGCALERMLGSSSLLVPMDGFHLPLAALKARPDAEDAIYRRGAPDTFDPASLQKCLQDIRNPDGPIEVMLPGFDHAKGDPVADQVRFDRAMHRIVLVEGLYLLHDADGWQGTAELFDWRLYLKADMEECIARVKERNKVIPGYTPEEIEMRCEAVDRRNAIIVQKSSRQADAAVPFI